MDDDEKLNLTEICLNAMPGFSCKLYENVVLGFLYILCGLSCIYYLYKIYRQIKQRKATIILEFQVIMYWISMFIFLIYKGILWLCKFPYTRRTLRILHNTSSILFIIPFGILILIVCEILFLSFNPGKSVTMLRIIVFVFLATFIIIGFLFSFYLNAENSDSESNSNKVEFPLFIWTCCTNLIIVIFTSVPAVELIRSYSFPFAQEEDKNCINFSKFSVVSFIVIMSLRLLYNFFQFIDANPITDWYNKGHFRYDSDPTIGTRIYGFFYFLVFDLLPVLIANFSINILYTRHISTSRDQYALA